jgi:MoaA/NifB/PqqE/SkfB family radical SAM enzyme
VVTPLLVVEDRFRAGADTVGHGPVRLHVNLTERCQLRCAHCITDAPARSLDGTAREMTQAVLDALAPSLALVRHVSLTHAGEPMLAPMFTPLLEALQARSPGARVHLLTNGVAMTDARFRDAIARGVRTLSVSLDGLSRASNDLLRIGSRASSLVERIAALAAIARAHEGVRVGVSWTLTRTNLGELTRAVDVLADAGASWLKVEELVDRNDATRALTVAPDDSARALAAAAERARARALPLLDHTRDVFTWRCGPDVVGVPAGAQETGALDDLANGWDLNPCRAPYEVACIDPDGAVRPVSFHHAVAGNLLAEPLETLFDSAPFRAARAHARMMRLCGRAAPSCPANPGAISREGAL